MSKYWNELLRHWRSGLKFFLGFVFIVIIIILFFLCPFFSSVININNNVLLLIINNRSNSRQKFKFGLKFGLRPKIWS